MCCKQRSGCLDDGKPRVSEVECPSLKSKYGVEIDKNRKGKMIILDWTPSYPNSTCSRASEWKNVFELSVVSTEPPSRWKWQSTGCTSCFSAAFFTCFHASSQVPFMGFSLDLNLQQNNGVSPILLCRLPWPLTGSIQNVWNNGPPKPFLV